MDLSRLLVPLLVWSVACGDDAGASDSAVAADTGIDFDASDLSIAPPQPAILPMITPCPAGWAEVAGEVTTCEPWALDSMPTCADHEARFVGDAACARVGTDCAADGWPADLPSGATVVFVREGATGTGTRAEPFGTLTEALAGATPGTVVAVAIGDYDEAVDVPEAVTIHGACPERTVVTTDRAAVDRGVFTVTGDSVEIRNIRIANADRGGVFVVGAGRSLTLRDVVIHDVRAVGIDAELGGQIDAENVVVRRVTPTAAGTFGRGVSTENGATASYRRLVVEEATEFGLLSIGTDTRVTVEDAWIANTNALPSGVAGAGLVTWNGGSITGRRIAVEGNTDVGIGGNLGRFDLEMALVRGTRARPMEGDHGRGFNLEAGSTSTCRRCVAEDNGEFGILLDGHTTEASFDHLVVRRTAAVDGSFGRAITVQAGANIDVTRALLVDNVEVGVALGGRPPSTGTMSDLTIRRITTAPASGAFGRAITVQNEASLTVMRGSFEDVFEAGIFVERAGSRFVGEDIVVRNVQMVDAMFPAGRGVIAQLGGAVELRRVVIEDVNDLGLVALHDGATLDVEDLVLRGVRELSCEVGLFCEEAPGGHGVTAYVGATAVVERFSITNAQICGVHVAEGGTVRLMNGLVTGSTIGACVQSEAQLVDDLQHDVRYVDNLRSLDSTSLPVPGGLPEAMDPM